MNEFEFLEERVQQIKEELKLRKKWARELIDEYCKVRTQKSEAMKKQVLRQHNIACIMVKHYENILKEHEEMLKELKNIK